MFKLLCDFVVVAEDDAGYEIAKIDLGEAAAKSADEKIFRGRRDDDRDKIILSDSCSVSIMTEKELLESIETYFQTHDIHKFSSLDLLYEIGADHLCAFFDADFFCEED